AGPEAQRAAQAQPELLVLVAMFGNHTVRIELDHAHGDAVAVHRAYVHAVPDPLQIGRGDVPEGAHNGEPKEAKLQYACRSFGSQTEVGLHHYAQPRTTGNRPRCGRTAGVLREWSQRGAGRP